LAVPHSKKCPDRGVPREEDRGTKTAGEKQPRAQGKLKIKSNRKTCPLDNPGPRRKKNVTASAAVLILSENRWDE